MTRPGGAGAPGVLHVVPGPDDHGITRHALGLLAQGDAPRLRLDPVGPDPAGLVDQVVGQASGRGVHLHLNDTLLGPRTVEVVAGIAGHLPVSLTLHDLPDPREGVERYRRRARAYTALWRASRGVVLASRHEQGLLEAAARHSGARPADLPPVWVVPLPLAPAGPPGAVDGLEPVVAVLGWVYPGKGHEQALSLAAALGLSGVVALGTTSPGHQQLATDLARRADELGIGWELTGFLPDDELLARARRVALPLAWHAHASASGSIGSWLQAARRPLVADGGWVRELAERCPGTVTVVADEADLLVAGAAALADPTRTLLAPGTRLDPTPAQAWEATDRAVRRAHGARPDQAQEDQHDA